MQENNIIKKRQPAAWLFLILALLSVAGMIFSILLIKIKLDLNLNPQVEACGYATGLGCQGPNTSSFSEIFGIPIAYYGMLTYAVMLALSIAGLVFRASYAVAWYFAISGWNVIYSIFLLIISLVSLNTICPWCAALYIVSGAQFAFCLPALAARPWHAPAVACKTLLATARKGLTFMGAAFGVSLIFLAGWAVSYEKPVPISPKKASFIEKWSKEAIFDVSLTIGEKQGPDSAPVIIVEYTDFRCPYCRLMANTLKDAGKEYGNLVQIVFKDYPLDKKCNRYVTMSVHADACVAHAAAFCAGEQDQFWSMSNLLWSIKERLLTVYHVRSYAKKMGLDLVEYDKCISSGRYLDTFRTTIDEGMKLKVMGTPTVFINGKRLGGSVPLKRLEWIIDWELEQQGIELPPRRLKKIAEQAEQAKKAKKKAE
jgi:protein-disulfide isomerase/uncharacterized membrane protein